MDRAATEWRDQRTNQYESAQLGWEEAEQGGLQMDIRWGEGGEEGEKGKRRGNEQETGREGAEGEERKERKGGKEVREKMREGG